MLQTQKEQKQHRPSMRHTPRQSLDAIEKLLPSGARGLAEDTGRRGAHGGLHRVSGSVSAEGGPRGWRRGSVRDRLSQGRELEEGVLEVAEDVFHLRGRRRR